MDLFLRRIYCLRLSLPLKFDRTTPRAFSAAPSRASPPNPHVASDYLVQSCGLSSDEALKASKYIEHLKSSDKLDRVLRFLRETGVKDSDIKTAVSRDSRILRSNLEKNWKPNIARLQEVGLSIQDISGIISRKPFMFRYNIVQKIDFFMGALGSAEFLSVLLEGDASLFSSSLEKVIMPNISFLKAQCGLSPRQIVRLVKSNPRLFTCTPEVLKRQAERAEALGVSRSKRTFVHALIVVGYLNQCTIEARLNNLICLGLSHEEVASLVSRVPVVLSTSEEVVGRKMEFLLNEAGCDKMELVRNPFLLTLSLDNRLIPRSVVRELLRSRGLPVGNLKLVTFMKPSEEKFVVKFILPFEDAIPGLHRAYNDARKIKVDD
jgi:mTERF domain-containing protein, mitochondrial